MATEKQIAQRDKYKKALKTAKVEYAKIPDKKKSRKAWNNCMKKALKGQKGTTAPKTKKEPETKPKSTKKTKKSNWLNWNWED